MKESFCFILNPLEVEGELPVELISNHWLQKANPQQVELIQEQLRTNFARHFPLPPYEHDWIEEVGDGKSGSSRVLCSLSADKHRYWIVSFEGINTHIYELQLAANLVEHDLDFGFIHLFSPEGKPFGTILGHANASSYFEPQHQFPWNLVFRISVAELRKIGGYFELIKTCEKQQPHIFRSVREFFQLKSLPRNSSMVILGYFAIIESLVTHDPKDDFDSLNHQISTKMTLLSKKFERQLDYDGTFGQIEPEKVWKKLYGYRSALAHGTPPDFKTTFRSLKDPSNALGFLKEAAKLTLLFAMKEPEFVADLKKC